MFGLLSSLSVSSGKTGCVPMSHQTLETEIAAGNLRLERPNRWRQGRGTLINQLVNPCSSFSARRAALLNIYGCSLGVFCQAKGWVIGDHLSAKVPARFYGLLKRTALVWCSVINFTLAPCLCPSAGIRFCTKTAAHFDAAAAAGSLFSFSVSVLWLSQQQCRIELLWFSHNNQWVNNVSKHFLSYS